MPRETASRSKRNTRQKNGPQPGCTLRMTRAKMAKGNGLQHVERIVNCQDSVERTQSKAPAGHRTRSRCANHPPFSWVSEPSACRHPCLRRHPNLRRHTCATTLTCASPRPRLSALGFAPHTFRPVVACPSLTRPPPVAAEHPTTTASRCSHSKLPTSPSIPRRPFHRARTKHFKRSNSRTESSNQHLSASPLAAPSWTGCWSAAQISTRLSMCASPRSSPARMRRCSGCGGRD